MSGYLNIEAGMPIKGIHVSEQKFQGVSTLDQLEAFGLQRPSRLTKARVKERDQQPMLDRQCNVRDSVQRRFDKDRIHRAEVYARYIESVEHLGKIGGTPAITMYLQKAKDSPPDAIVVPYGAVLVAIDGETQTEARFILRDDENYERRESGEVNIAVTIYHDVPEEFAQQILHDYNHYASPMNEKQLAGLNAEGPLTKAAISVFDKADIDLDTVKRFGAIPGKKHTLSQLQVMFAIIGHTMKESALTKDGSSWLKVMNDATSATQINGSTVEIIGKLTASAARSDAARKASLPVWQVAGVLASQGRNPSKLNWSAGVASMKGVRGKERLQSIAKSL
jgi:hypothetical protein